MKFRHSKNSGSFGNWYLFGLNLYKDDISWTIDLIIGKHIFVWDWDTK